jgi:hypothetical protein
MFFSYNNFPFSILQRMIGKDCREHKNILWAHLLLDNLLVLMHQLFVMNVRVNVRMYVHYVCLYITCREQGQVGSRWPGIQYQDIHQLLSRSNPISCHQPAFIAASFIQTKGRDILCWTKFAETRNTLHGHSSIIEKKPDHKQAGDRNYCIRQRDNDGSLIV